MPRGARCGAHGLERELRGLYPLRRSVGGLASLPRSAAAAFTVPGTARGGLAQGRVRLCVVDLPRSCALSRSRRPRQPPPTPACPRVPEWKHSRPELLPRPPHGAHAVGAQRATPRGRSTSAAPCVWQLTASLTHAVAVSRPSSRVRGQRLPRGGRSVARVPHQSRVPSVDSYGGSGAVQFFRCLWACTAVVGIVPAASAAHAVCAHQGHRPLRAHADGHATTCPACVVVARSYEFPESRARPTRRAERRMTRPCTPARTCPF